ncbi:MAG: helix-turn-helix transcriptional regulator [Acidimicrobiales bacterium]
MASLDRLERLTDLVLLLLHSPAPRTLEDIARAVPGYPTSPTARRQAFERDKRVLRDEGIPVVTEPIEGPDQYGYRIDADAFYLPDLGLEPDEQAALHLAVAGVHFGDPSGRDALAKLGATGAADARPLAALAPPPALATLFDAVHARRELRFHYHDESRVVSPAVLRFHGGRWYLTAWDHARAGARTFRVDRIVGPVAAGLPESGTVPVPVDTKTFEVPLEPYRLADEDDTDFVLVRVDAVEGPRVVTEVGAAAVAERDADGGVLLRLGVTSFDSLRSWVLGLLDHAELVGPPVARDAMVRWLEETSRAGAAAGPGSAGDGAVRGGDAGGGDGREGRDGRAPRRVRGGGRARAPRQTSLRLRRLLAIVSWLAEVGEARIDEISARFDIAPDEVVRELELAACCGVPPYSPDTLLEIMVSEDVVQAFLPRELARPRRLTPEEGLALAASARTILAVPGADRNGALARALAKLDVVLGDRAHLVIDIDAPARLVDVRTIVDAGMQAVIEYHSASTDEDTERVVEPIAVAALEGHWYLDAYCHRAQGVRRFRVDRIRSLRQLDRPVGEHVRSLPVPPEAFVSGPGAAQVTLRLGAVAQWVVETVPILSEREGPGATIEVTLAVGGRAWLERLLLQLGPDACVLAPPDMRDLGPMAATRLLARYRELRTHDTIEGDER